MKLFFLLENKRYMNIATVAYTLIDNGPTIIEPNKVMDRIKAKKNIISSLLI